MPIRSDSDGRALTHREWAELSRGLADALAAASATPRIENRAHPAAQLARWRFGGVPILVLGQTIWWPEAGPDLSGTTQMAVLQHELQHVLDFAEGRLTVLGYLTRPRNWTYRWRLTDDLCWSRLGAEQRASVAEALWRAERAGCDLFAAALRKLIPWAAPEPDSACWPGRAASRPTRPSRRSRPSST